MLLCKVRLLPTQQSSFSFQKITSFVRKNLNSYELFGFAKFVFHKLYHYYTTLLQKGTLDKKVRLKQ